MDETLAAWPDGIKKTRQRTVVLHVLRQSPRPLSAMEISAQAEKLGQPLWLSTVYRALEIFVEREVVVRIVLSGDLAVYEPKRPHHSHYAVCLGCRKTLRLEHCPMELHMPLLPDPDFQVLGHNLEIYGYCKDCRGL
ncbi:Zinc-specific metallo-regulatory protein [bioreactor metagenome]|uniref:Zinc-specific metallo-regulatory protein n=1 Tax=bioreactor metagenome TaxID=1076179 RepID=A0A644ZIT7_9ZZZZ